MEKQKPCSSIKFFVNGHLYTVHNADPMMTVNIWLRTQPGLNGTKIMCEEGGCGCCIIGLEKPTGQLIAVNSCLLLLCSIDECSVVTTEGLGCRKEGFHEIHTRLAQYGGSQCGYCTPGFAMCMYSLLSSDLKPSQQTVEDNFDGMICRCTGYRPILDAMKSFSVDSKCHLNDIEDIGKSLLRTSMSTALSQIQSPYIEVNDEFSCFIRPASLGELKNIFKSKPSIQIVCGNTATGIYKRTNKSVQLVDLSRLNALTKMEEENASFKCGASVSLTRLVNALSAASSQNCSVVSAHLKKVGNRPVRNVASWAGNLMIKYAHRDFPSDVFVLLEALNVGIDVLVVDNGESFTCSPAELMDINMTGKVITGMTLNKHEDRVFKSFKIMPRSQNAHAYVNAAFLVKFSESRTFVDKPRLVFGGISGDFVHASKTEEFLIGKRIDSEATFSEALSILSQEIRPIQYSAVDASVKYKHDLALGLFYKFYLSICDESLVGPDARSGRTNLVRPVSHGTQTFDKDPDIFPVSDAIPKIAAKVQASGEAKFISDKIPTADELHCAFVTSTVGNADIDIIDESHAASMKGFVQIIKGGNIPSGVKNTWLYPWDVAQPLIAVDHVDFAGQPVAIVIAETSSQARAIANAVKVTYKNKKKLILTVKDAIEENSYFDLPCPVYEKGNAENAVDAAKHTVSGEIHLGHQYHFYMETQIARAETTEEGGFKLESATQLQKRLQDALAFTFGVSVNKIEVNTKRIGGAYGGKATNSLLTSCAAALAAYCTKRPVCFHADLKTCMTTYGTRTPFSIYYTAGFDDDGVVQALDCKLYTSSGPTPTDGEADDDDIMAAFADSGSLQLTGTADQIMEHVASYLGKDPVTVKQLNLYKKGQLDFGGIPISSNNLEVIFKKLLKDAKIQERQTAISTFNASNRWKKKGLAVSPMKYRVGVNWGKYGVLVSICAEDGSVVVSHGGIESGQGINTKVAQVAAFALGIPVDDVLVQRTSSITSANSECTGGSITSEVTCKTVLECCKILKTRMEPVRSKMPGDSSWRDVARRCYQENVELSATCMWFPPDGSDYDSFGATASEVEVDVLTGEYIITRVDTVFDCGISLNPSIDIGQVEGAFVMGLGFWLTEKMVIDSETGRMLTDGTWEYKPPTSKDIPVEWNIELLRNAPNPVGVLRSKASGEPPMCMAVSVVDALKRAVESTKLDRGLKKYFQMPTPSTVESLFLSFELDPSKDFKLL